jgi:hypothetical protein
MQKDSLEDCELPEKDEHAHDGGPGRAHDSLDGHHDEKKTVSPDHHSHDDSEQGSHAH